MATIDDILGSPDFLRNLIGEEQFARSKEQALNQGILQASLAALGGRGTVGQVLSQAGTAGMQGYQGAFDKTLTDMLKATQISEMVRKQKEQQQIKDVLASAAKPQYTYGAGEQGPTRELTGMTYDMKSVIPTLQALGRFDLIKDIGQSQQEIRKSGIMSEGMQAPSPFAPYLQATNPAVRQLATQLQSGFERGIIDEETAYKRIEPLAKMEESYVAKSEKAAEGKKPTEAEGKAAGYAQRMELAELNMNRIENAVAKQQLKDPNTKYQTPYESTATRFAGGVPLIGEWARSKVATEQQKSYRQAQENWVRANLRKESGAVIGPDEMQSEIANYFPMPNDPPSLVEQKRINRQLVTSNMKREAGRAYEPFDYNRFVKDNGLEGRK